MNDKQLLNSDGQPIPQRRARVCIVVPSYDTWEASMGYDTVRLAIFSAPYVDLTISYCKGQDTAEGRNFMVDSLRNLPPQHKMDAILWIDSDMTFPPDSLIRLINARRAIVGADYRKRIPPHHRIGQWVNPQDPFGEYIPVPPEAPTTGLDDNMAVLGFGLLLTSMRIFEYEDWPRPWFVRSWNAQTATPDNPSGFSTEDYIFCIMARAHGAKITCDLDLSREVTHLGQTSIPFHFTVPKSDA